MELLVKPPKNAFNILVSAWQSWERTDHQFIPTKKAMQIQDIVKIIPYVTIIKIHEGGIVEYRIIGEQQKLLSKKDRTHDNTGNSPSVIDEQIDFHKTLISSIKDYEQGVIVTRLVPDELHVGWTYRTLLLPLTDGNGSVDHSIVCGLLEAPEGTLDNKWHGGRSINLMNTFISQAQSIDVGNGCFNFKPYEDELLKVLPPLQLTALLSD